MNFKPQGVIPALVTPLTADYQLNEQALRKAFSLGTHPTMLKEALEILGIEAGPCLPPIGRMSGEEKEQLTAVLAELQLI